MEVVGNGGPAGAGQQPQININLAEMPDVKCTECDGIYFEQAIRFKKISKLLTAAPEDGIAPVQIWLCKSCGTPSETLMPEGL